MEQEFEHPVARPLLESLPADGSPLTKAQLLYQLNARLKRDVADSEYRAAVDELVQEGLAQRGRGRGGSVRRARALTVSDPLADDRPDPGSVLQSEPPRSTGGQGSANKAKYAKRRGNRSGAAGAAKLVAYRHDQHRVNNPEVGMVGPDSDPASAPTVWQYDPHLDPALQFDIRRADIEKLIDDALADGGDESMRTALQELRRLEVPYLQWTGRAERTSFEVDTVSLHVHERLDPATILNAIRKRMTRAGDAKVVQEEMFQAWFERPLPYRTAVEFYRHDRGWANRLITGDSLLVMNSLLQKEAMAGQVQMIYIDPPYGIRYGSNFQPFVNKRDVKDRKDEDLTQEPEMIKAFRDTWELGTHSYLTYLHDRLWLARALLHESGSVFVQISDENLHHVRELCDEIFGAENFVSVISFQTQIPLRNKYIANVNDYLVWYGKAYSSGGMKFNRLFVDQDVESSQFSLVEMPDGQVLPRSVGRPGFGRVFTSLDLSSSGATASCMFDFDYWGNTFSPTRGKSWKTTRDGLATVGRANRLYASGSALRYRLFHGDYPVSPLTNAWSDTVGVAGKVFVVQTDPKVIERCLLMTTDPGDLILDPTCGSGTTAVVAEKWGRRWITCDTSRVAVTLAKQRLVTASYDYYELKYPQEGLKAGFIYATVPHVTLKSIANNPEINEIYEAMHVAVEAALAKLNSLLRSDPPEPFEVAAGGRKGSAVDFGAGPSVTVRLPSGEQAPVGALLEWEVPFEFPISWPSEARSAFDAFQNAREAMQKRIDASIAAHADQEVLYNRPQVAEDKLRVTGPFTIEAVPFPSVASVDQVDQGMPADQSVARSGESARQHGWRDELFEAGVRGKGGQKLEFAELDTLPGTRYLHCSGSLAETGDRVVVSFGPEYAALEQRQVEMAIREAGELFPRPKMIVFCAFAFDPEAAKDIDSTKGITALKVQMNTDLLTEDLKKARSSNQSFWLMGQPDVEVRKRKDGRYEVEVNGFDYFDTVKGELLSGGKKKIAAWSLDTDYDERSMFPRQVFFPMAGAKDGWHKLRKDIRAELNEAALSKLQGTTSLPFHAGDNRKIAVKIVDDRGIESLKVMALP